jgi:hypothetical protein
MERKYTVDKALFLQIGRILQKSFKRSWLGKVELSVSGGHLTIDCEMGGGVVPCKGDGKASAALSATSFVTLLAAHGREKNPTGEIPLVFRLDPPEVAVDKAGVKAIKILIG